MHLATLFLILAFGGASSAALTAEYDVPQLSQQHKSLRRTLLGSLASTPSPAPTPAPAPVVPITVGQWFLGLISGAQAPEADGRNVVSASGATDELSPSTFVAPSVNTTFVQQLVEVARGLQEDEDLPSLQAGDVIDEGVHQALCDSQFLREQNDQTELDDTYRAAHPLHAGGRLPEGCMTGCIIGSGYVETIARIYGLQRTLTPSSWQGKCFSHNTLPAGGTDEVSEGAAAVAGNITATVTNRIRVNYGWFLNRIFGFNDPVEMFPGSAYLAPSDINSNNTLDDVGAGTAPVPAGGDGGAGDAIVVDYSAHDHEFSGFKDELREVYPGTYLGRMYALPGAELWGGALSAPVDGGPIFALNFVLFAHPGDNVYSLHESDGEATIAEV